MVETLTRRVRVEQIMGTAISIDVRDIGIDGAAMEMAFEWLRQVDTRFSPYKPASEISRLGRGELILDDCHADVARVLSLCEDLRRETDGVFNAWACRADGRLDPSGVVKGWAVEHAAELLVDAGARNFCINAGGDIVARGKPQPGRDWRIGIRHPSDASALATVVYVTDLAVATSGNYERGDHITDARTGVSNRELCSLTVAGPSLMLADAYATAGFAMGLDGVAWVTARPPYAAYAVTFEDRIRYSDAFQDLMVSRSGRPS